MTSVTPLEAAVVKRIEKLLKQRGAWHIKTTGVSMVGCPDIVACYRGAFIAFEVKREKHGKYGATLKQRFELAQIAKAGGHNAVVSSVEEVETILAAVDAWVER